MSQKYVRFLFTKERVKDKENKNVIANCCNVDTYKQMVNK